MEDKSNEITAIPEVLSAIDIEDAVISIDAMGTQREVVDLIFEKKGHYLLSVKVIRSLYMSILNVLLKYTAALIRIRLWEKTMEG